MKNKTIFKVLSMALSMSILFASCTKYDSLEEEQINVENQKLRREQSLSGKELFSSLFFLGSSSGLSIDHTEFINNYIATLPTEAQSEYKNTVNTILEKIDSDDPNFFNEFKEELSTGKHSVISETLKKGHQAMENAIYSIPSLSEALLVAEGFREKVDINDFIDDKGVLKRVELDEKIREIYGDEVNPSSDFIGPTVLAIAVAVVMTVGVVLNYGAWVFVVYDVPTDKVIDDRITGESLLQHEILVNDISEYFN